jgi:endonuclease IV
MRYIKKKKFKTNLLKLEEKLKEIKLEEDFKEEMKHKKQKEVLIKESPLLENKKKKIKYIDTSVLLTK